MSMDSIIILKAVSILCVLTAQKQNQELIFFLHCHYFSAIRVTHNNSLKAIDKDIPKLSDSSIIKVILYGDSKYSDIQNHDILSSTITYILDSKRFNSSLLQCKAPLSIYSKIHVIFVRNILTMLSLFNLIFFPKLHCSNENRVKKIVSIFLSLLFFVILTLLFS